MTPEQEAQIFGDLGAIKTGLINLNSSLTSHTQQDMEQFDKMTQTVEALGSKITQLLTERAVEAGVKQEHDRHIKRISGWTAGVVGFFVSTGISLFSTWLQTTWGK